MTQPDHIKRVVLLFDKDNFQVLRVQLHFENGDIQIFRPSVDPSTIAPIVEQAMAKRVA
jgi:hypothetical protein